MVNVFTARELCACISATMREESIPPDKNAPIGTSATICSPTDLLNKTSSWLQTVPALAVRELEMPDSATSITDQYRRGSTEVSGDAPAPILTIDPGKTLLMP